uniref:Dynein heavy chain hydrolytic ATP-binding dynein motor region domain-containing protein n=1 Tax=Phlebotomus papatasi TaxID=29031 RepID=A0A1B0DHB1_PHLPP
MIVPDIELICEILLVAEGFQNARALARKFISLYSMCRELLSKQDHYDWGLRAVKSVLIVAGSLKRADPARSEDEVLMRALRDFNTPKITIDDTPVFLGLIGDLFPALDVPRQRNTELEEVKWEWGMDKGVQDGFHLNCYNREGFHGYSIELIETSKSTSLCQTFVDVPTRFIIHLFRAIKHIHHHAQSTSKILSCFSLSSPCWSCRSTSHE